MIHNYSIVTKIILHQLYYFTLTQFEILQYKATKLEYHNGCEHLAGLENYIDIGYGRGISPMEAQTTFNKLASTTSTEKRGQGELTKKVERCKRHDIQQNINE